MEHYEAYIWLAYIVTALVLAGVSAVSIYQLKQSNKRLRRLQSESVSSANES